MHFDGLDLSLAQSRHIRLAAVASVGCKVNRYDAQTVISELQRAGYGIVEFSAKADVYVINTCAVTGEAAKKSRGFIRRAVSSKRKLNPNAVIVVAGCWSEVERENALAIEGVSAVIGTKDYHSIVQVIDGVLGVSAANDCAKVSAVNDAKNTIKTKNDMTRAYLKIEDGCENFCSYCIIPYARGKVKSRLPAEILAEASQLTEKGFKEIVLTGIHVASYGKDLDVKTSLADVSEAVNGVNGLLRLRLSSLSPKAVTEEFAERLKTLNAFCDYFHLSLQSGSESVLSRMERGYSPGDYLNAVNILKRAFPDCAVWSDIIAGFPGETDKEFEESIAFIEKSGIVNLHVFPFSPKKGTKAFEMGEKVAGDIKAARAKTLKRLGDKLYERFLTERLGQEYDVLIENERNWFYQGHTRNYILVKVCSDVDIVNEIVRVRLDKAENNNGVYEVLGTLVDPKRQ